MWTASDTKTGVHFSTPEELDVTGTNPPAIRLAQWEAGLRVMIDSSSRRFGR
jgi:hypothetical protein